MLHCLDNWVVVEASTLQVIKAPVAGKRNKPQQEHVNQAVTKSQGRARDGVRVGEKVVVYLVGDRLGRQK